MQLPCYVLKTPLFLELSILALYAFSSFLIVESCEDGKNPLDYAQKLYS